MESGKPGPPHRCGTIIIRLRIAPISDAGTKATAISLACEISPAPPCAAHHGADDDRVEHKERVEQAECE
jgi:hypothetical protein